MDFRKTFNTVSHTAVLEALPDAYPGKRLRYFVRTFLKDRTFEIRSGRPDTQQFTNCSGVTQGVIISPILLNLVMARLIKGVAFDPGVRITVYADDVTNWTEANNHATTYTARQKLQYALDAFTVLFTRNGMEVSLAKTYYHVVRGTVTDRARAQSQETQDLIEIREVGRSEVIKNK